MSQRSGTLLKPPDNVRGRQPSLAENKALEDAFRRIDSGVRFSPVTPEITNYDDFHYDDCGYDDAPQ